MNKLKKILLSVVAVILAVAAIVAIVASVRIRNSKGPTIVTADEYPSVKTTVSSEESSDNDEEETDWPFADDEDEAEFVVKTTTKKAKENDSSKKDKKDKNSKDKEKDKDSSMGKQKAYLNNLFKTADKKVNGHPCRNESETTTTEYQKYAIADFNGDGKLETMVFTTTYTNVSANSQLYSSYFILDENMQVMRITRTAKVYSEPVFYDNGVFKIGTEYGFVSNSVASDFGISDSNSVVGYETSATPYLKYSTKGAYIDAPKEISKSTYDSEIAKLTKGKKVAVKIYDLTESNIANLK
ncbi:MAG: hypothetical protein MJ129_00060 [Clostridia bacterium]|nr:hypothetical protein [Clostridia bacterium]